MKHKHADLIHAWADGAEIQYKTARDIWVDCDCNKPEWLTFIKYRIKPEEKKPVVRWLWVSRGTKSLSGYMMSEEEAKDMGWNVKLEWSRTEFPE